MSETILIKTPDLGIDSEVDIIEVLIKVGDHIEEGQSLISLESEKASMEIPATHSGIVKEIYAKVGDKIKSDEPILDLEISEVSTVSELGGVRNTSEVNRVSPGHASSSPSPVAPSAEQAQAPSASQAPPSPSLYSPSPSTPNAPTSEPAAAAPISPPQAPTGQYDLDVLVIGAGPGGYTSAFRSADLGLEVGLVERYPVLGGVCLNVGCIPSKALLHTAQILNDSRHASKIGIHFAEPKVDLERLRTWKSEVTGKLNKGLATMAKQRKVKVMQGVAKFTSPHTVEITHGEQKTSVSFAHAVIATGSRPVSPKSLQIDHKALLDSTDALELRAIPEKMLVVGGGILGLEMATVYNSLGAKVTVVELADQLIPGADADIVKPLHKHLSDTGLEICLKTSVESLQPDGDKLTAHFSGSERKPETYDCILVATGRAPNTQDLNLQACGLQADKQGFLVSDSQMRTKVSHIFSIGDVRNHPMLAHKATHEGKVAAEVISGLQGHILDSRCIPSVAYTDPEVAWVGLTENEARSQGIAVQKAVFPFLASGRAIGMDRTEGMTKLLFSIDSRKRLLGGAIVGKGAGDLISEVALGIEMGSDAEDIALTIHPHPTLSETINFATEIAEGTVTDLYIPKRKL